jgi:hypothetical protein
VSDPAVTTEAVARSDKIWSVVKLPAQILLVGLSILLLAWLSSHVYLPVFNHLVTMLSDTHAGGADPDDHPILQTVVALSIFIVGLSFAGFLWWVVERYFSLISSGKMTADQLSDLKDLPMGLPEGSVRSVLALIVAVVGIPLLAFSKVIKLDPAIGGYLNGIITGVFGFYFGTRSGIVSNQAIDQITDAKSRADQAEDDRDQAQAETQQTKSLAQVGLQAATAAARAAGFGSTVSKLNRELGVASTILDVIEPALPLGILPAGLATAVTTAQTALDAVQGVTKDTVTDGQQSLLQDAVGALLGGASSAASGGAATSGSSAALGALIKTAAPMLSSLGIPGVGEVTALVALLSVGMKLGSQEYGRWRARVLAAPLAHGLIEFGTVTPDDAHAALLDAPLFAKAFAEEKDRPGFDADLADAVLRDDALERLWQRYGTATAGQPPLFVDRAHLETALAEFDQVLLATRSANDMPQGLPDPVTTALRGAKHPEIRAAATTTFTRDSLNKIVNAASKASTPAAATPKNTQAAFDALITLVGHSRQKGIDLIGSLAEVTP